MAIINIIDCTETKGADVASLTIRNLDEPLKSRLRIRAAARNRSMEEEARQILRAALQEFVVPGQDLTTSIRARFAALGDIQLTLEPRQPTRPPPDPAEPAQTGRAAERKAMPTRR